MIIKEKKIQLSRALPLLKSAGLNAPDNTDYTAGFYSGDKLVGTGSICGNILKGIAVHSDYRGENITSKIVSTLTDECFRREYSNFFIFTKDSEKDKFISLGFTAIGSVKGGAALLEYSSSGIKRFRKKLSAVSGLTGGEIKGAVVMNCNPFTKGHRYLIEKGASETDHLFVIIVEEDKSVFPFEKRIDLVRKGTEDLDNVTVIPGGPYTISSATFPSYFVKEGMHSEYYATLDLNIFINHTAEALSVTKRFIGEEPYCPVTSVYNKCIKEMLPGSGIDAVEIPRITTCGNTVSASKVRALIKENKIKETEKYLPPSTYAFICSDECREIIDNIKTMNSRH